jgi:hypothetical protein
MSVLIPPPTVRRMRIRYFSSGAHDRAVIGQAGRRREVRVGFTPWVVANGGAHAPSVIYGSGERSIVAGDYEVVLEPLQGGTNERGGGIFSQRRRESPVPWFGPVQRS